MYGGGLGYYPYAQSKGLISGLSGLKSKINFTSILDNTQRVLNIANQTIPIINQVKPMVSNAKTLFKIMGAVKASDAISNSNSNNEYNNSNKKNYYSNSQSEYKKTNYYNDSNQDYTNVSTNTPNFFL